MKLLLITAILCITSCTEFRTITSTTYWNSPEESNSETLFGFDRVNNFALTFYDENWADSLKKHYGDDESFYMPARFEGNGTVLDSVGVRYKGNSSYVAAQNSAKKPLKIKFAAFKPQTFYGAKQLNFGNCAKDPSFMREVLSYRALSNYTSVPRTAFANITANGELLGLYVQVEQVNEDFLTAHFSSDAGNLYKVGDHGAGLEWLGDDAALYEAEYDLKNNGTANDWSRFVSLLNMLNNSEVSLDTILDIDRAVTLLAFNMVASNFDSYTGSGRNYYLYDNPVTEKFTLLPWDQNEAFGSYSNGWDVVNNSITSPANIAKRPLTRRILENSSLKRLYLDKITAMIEGAFNPDTIASWADQLKPVIESSVEADQNKLYSTENFHTNIESSLSLGLSGSIPGVKSFSLERTAAIHAQLDEAYEAMN